ncbi:hypothetical protein OROMI_027540 [Orobanche minor]
MFKAATSITGDTRTIFEHFSTDKPIKFEGMQQVMASV